MSLSTVWHAVTDYHDIGDQWIVHDLRILRTVLALLVGLALGLSGALIQAVGRNPLADTEILGINSGAALFVVSAIALLGLTGIWTYIWFAFAGALFAMMLVYLVGMTGPRHHHPGPRAARGRRRSRAVLDGISYAVRLRNPQRLQQHAVLGRRRARRPVRSKWPPPSHRSSPSVWCLCVVVGRSLNVAALGDDLAKSMGGNVARTQALSLIAVTLLAGAATAGAGPIGFVGLDGAARGAHGSPGRTGAGSSRYATVVAPALLLAADIVGRVVIRPSELPAGIVTAFLGAPVLIWLIRKRGRIAGDQYPGRSGDPERLRAGVEFGRRHCVIRIG